MKSKLGILSFLFYIFASVLIPTTESYAQCCAAGNPSSTNCSIDQGGKNSLQVSYFHMYSTSDVYYDGVNQSNYKYATSDFNFSSLALSYGITNDLRLTADLGYFLNKSQTFTNGYNRQTSGLSDATFGISYQTYKSTDKLFDITQSLRFTVPVGQFNQEFDGVILPIDFQPSSGNFKYNLGLVLSKRFSGSPFSLVSVNSMEVSQFIETENSRYKYGNLYNVSLIGRYVFEFGLTASLQMRCEVREKALNGPKSQDNTFNYINASGGVVAFISPQLSYNLYKDFGFTLQYNHPLYKNVNGLQLTNKYSISAGLSKSFNFSSVDEPIAEIERDASLSKFSISVSGNCEMCKARIEESVNEISNVASSDWSPDTKELIVYYKDIKPDVDGIEQALAAVGHDTDKYKAKLEVYDKLPKCCLYRSK